MRSDNERKETMSINDNNRYHINLSLLSEQLRASVRTTDVTDMGNGLIVTDERTPYLKTYVQPNGIVRPRWEYPAPDRRGRIRGLKPYDVEAVKLLDSPIIPLTPFPLTGAAGQQTLLMRLHLDRQAWRLAPHQVHTSLRLMQLTFSAEERYGVWRAWQRLLQNAIDDGGADTVLAAPIDRTMQLLVDALAAPAGPSLVAALIIDEVERIHPDADAQRGRDLRHAVEDIDYSEEDQEDQLSGLVDDAISLIEATTVRPDITRLTMMRALLTGVVNRLPDSALAASGTSRAVFGSVIILVSWWLGRGLDRLAESALRLELATGPTAGTRAVRNSRPGWMR